MEKSNQELIQEISNKIAGLKKKAEFVSSSIINLQEATKDATISFIEFEAIYQKAFPKQAKKEKLRNDKISDLHTEIGEYLFEEGLICKGCDLEGTHCEGSKCGTRMDAFYLSKTKDEIQKLCFKAIGNKFYNQSLKIKNELRK